MKKALHTLATLGLLTLFATSSQATVIGIATDGLFAEGTANSVNEERTYVGTQSNGNNTWSTYLTFDLTEYTGDLGAASFTLDYTLTVGNNTPGNIQIDYLGTYADNSITDVNGAAWFAATAVEGFTVTGPTAGDKTLDVSSIASDTFTNDYAVFRYTVAGAAFANNNYWIVGTAANQAGDTSGATLTVVPEPGAYALIAGLLGLSFVMLRRR